MRYANNSFVSNPGDPMHVLYSPKVSKSGRVELVESGVQNTDEVIQSYAESCDRALILERIKNGELDLLQKAPGVYGDFTKMPKTFGDVLQLQLDSNRLFDTLPLEIRSKFDNDRNQFFAQAGTKDWFEILSPVLPEDVRKMINPPVVEDVKSEVTSVE